MKIYVPSYNSSNCVVLQNNNTIRVYNTVPTQNSTVSYTDYYISSSYLSNIGTQTFNQYSTVPTCISSSNITTDFYYRLDLDKILVCFFIIVIICFYFPFRLFSRIFGRWLKW